MGWGDCGTDSNGRPIGYVFDAECDHPGCAEKIHRGLSYACGEMHGDDEISCERYFCLEHRSRYIEDRETGRNVCVCESCARLAVEDGEFYDDPDDGVIRRAM